MTMDVRVMTGVSLRNGEQLKVIKENNGIIMAIHQKGFVSSDVGGKGLGSSMH